jgi:hypothetical protein
VSVIPKVDMSCSTGRDPTPATARADPWPLNAKSLSPLPQCRSRVQQKRVLSMQIEVTL